MNRSSVQLAPCQSIERPSVDGTARSRLYVKKLFDTFSDDRTETVLEIDVSSFLFILHGHSWLRYHLRTWNEDGERLLVLLHGTQDSSATFQFLVDRLSPQWRIVAPDWRGFGRSEWASQGYFFQDYLADLDAILDRLSPQKPVQLVGHSLGGNVACVYSGVCPERVSHVVSLDGFGLPNGDPDRISRSGGELAAQLARRTCPPALSDARRDGREAERE